MEEEKNNHPVQNNSAVQEPKKEPAKELTMEGVQAIVEERALFLHTGKIPGEDDNTLTSLLAGGLGGVVIFLGFWPGMVVWYWNNTFLGANSIPLFKFLSMDNNGDNMGISILLSLGIVILALFGIACLISLIFTGGLSGKDFTEKYEEECKKTKDLVELLDKKVNEEMAAQVLQAEQALKVLNKEKSKLEKTLKNKEENFNKKVKELIARNKESEKVALSLMKENDELREEQNLLRRQLGNVQEDCKTALRKKENELDEMAHKNNLLRADLEHLRARNQGE